MRGPFFFLRDADTCIDTVGTIMVVFIVAKRRNRPLNFYVNTVYRAQPSALVQLAPVKQLLAPGELDAHSQGQEAQL